MRGDQLARQWRILRTIESKDQGATVAELTAQEDCHTRGIWRDLAAIKSCHILCDHHSEGMDPRQQLTC